MIDYDRGEGLSSNDADLNVMLVTGDNQFHTRKLLRERSGEMQ